MFKFKKNIVVGVSVTPEIGLEVAQIDFSSQVVLKYGVKPLDYHSNAREIADLDIFKETLQDLLTQLDIPKGSEIVLNLPTVEFKVNDYQAALDETQITGAIDDELAENPFFKNFEPCVSAVLLPNSTMQFNKIAYTALQKTMLQEIAMMIKDIGYKLITIDVSVNSVLNALIYKERINVEENTNWLMLIVENFCCRLISMNGKNYVDAFEEKISVAEVLGDAENYSTVLEAITPLIKNLPSQYLCVISKTNAISAEVLASKISYSTPIIHQEANGFSTEAFLEVGPNVDPSLAPKVTLDIIGAAIHNDFAQYSNAHFNLYNKSLGEIYTSEQPPEIQIAGRVFIFSNENLAKLFIILAIIILIPVVITCLLLFGNIKQKTLQSEELQNQIRQIDKFLKENEQISANTFDEGDEIRLGLVHNKNIYSYYTIVGTEIPKKLWLTHLKFSDKVTIEGQADNLESIYSFFRNIKDYDSSSDIKLQKLALASSNNIQGNETEEFDTESILTTMNADFYAFKISNAPEISKDDISKENGNSGKNAIPTELLEPIN